MKRPFEIIRESVSENLDKIWRNQRDNFANWDKYMIWIIGLSVGGLSLIVANVTSIDSRLSYCSLKFIISFLSISIVSGVIYRWAYYRYQIEHQNIEFFIQGSFSNKEMIEIEPDDLADTISFEEVIQRLMLDFGIAHSQLIEIFNMSTEQRQLELMIKEKDFYSKMGVWAKKDFELGMEFVKDTFNKAYGLSNKQMDKIFNSQSPNALKIYERIYVCASLISCLAFLIVIVFLTITF